MTAVQKEFDIGVWDVGNFRFKGRQFRGGVGSLGWFVDHCSPQLSFQLAELRRKQASPTVQDLLKLNKLIPRQKSLVVLDCIIRSPRDISDGLGGHLQVRKDQRKWS